MSLSRLQSTIEASTLSSEDKDLWLRIMEALDDDAAVTILESLSGDGDMNVALEEFTRSIKRKRDALANDDALAFVGIIDEEVKQIRNL